MIVKFFNWDQLRNVNNQTSSIKDGDVVVVSHRWGGLFLGEVVLAEKSIEKDESVGVIVRKATSQDREMILNNKDKEKKILTEVKKKIRKAELSMKVNEVRLSIDNKCLLIIFTADGRVDFREVVKELSAEYQKIVRFQQIGSRDEARNMGGYGICGKEVCCRKFPGILKSISTEMANEQLISHRGSERLSGLCGRLMCCLAFEVDQYKNNKNNSKKESRDKENDSEKKK